MTLRRSVTGGKVDQGVAGVSLIIKGMWDIMSVFPYLFRKCVGLAISALQWAAANIAQAIGMLVMVLLTLVYLDAVYQIRVRISCFLSPSLCVSGRDMRVR